MQAGASALTGATEVCNLMAQADSIPTAFRDLLTGAVLEPSTNLIQVAYAAAHLADSLLQNALTAAKRAA